MIIFPQTEILCVLFFSIKQNFYFEGMKTNIFYMSDFLGGMFFVGFMDVGLREDDLSWNAIMRRIP